MKTEITYIDEMTNNEVAELLLGETKQIKVTPHYCCGYESIKCEGRFGKSYHNSRKFTKYIDTFINHALQEFNYSLISIDDTELYFSGDDWIKIFLVTVSKNKENK